MRAVPTARGQQPGAAQYEAPWHCKDDSHTTVAGDSCRSPPRRGRHCPSLDPHSSSAGMGGTFLPPGRLACRHFCSSGHQLSPNCCSSAGIASGELLLLRGSTNFLCFGKNCLWQLGSHMMLGTPTHLIGGRCQKPQYLWPGEHGCSVLSQDMGNCLWPNSHKGGAPMALYQHDTLLLP